MRRTILFLLWELSVLAGVLAIWSQVFWDDWLFLFLFLTFMTGLPLTSIVASAWKPPATSKGAHNGTWGAAIHRVVVWLMFFGSMLGLLGAVVSNALGSGEYLTPLVVLFGVGLLLAGMVGHITRIDLWESRRW